VPLIYSQKQAHLEELPSIPTYIMEDATSSTENLLRKVNLFVKDYMSPYDASHDYHHVLRVLTLAQHILGEELKASPSISYDETVVTLAALLHDVGDTKYVEPGQYAVTTAESALLEFGAGLKLARCVQIIVENVSYSSEIRNPDGVRGVLQRHPELAIVQDADRLDAIGAIGIGRTFTFGGVKRREDGFEGTIKHFTDKLEKLESMMKTGTGRRLAKERTERLRVFRGWWDEENAMLGSSQD